MPSSDDRYFQITARVAGRFIEAIEAPAAKPLAERVARRFLAVDYLVIGKWYEQTFADGDKIYFKALAKQKNGGWAGVQVEVDPTRPRKKPKAKRYSTPKHATGWKECKDVPADVEEAAKGYDSGDKTAAIALRVALRVLASDFSDEELAAMAMIAGLKPGYRAEAFDRAGLGKYGPENPHIQDLIKKGLVKLQGGKAVTLDTSKAKTIMKQHKVPQKYKRDIDNPSMYFKTGE